MNRHLDNEYKNRWEEFYLIDGTIEDSRQKNWRDVAWDKVIKIKAHLNGNVHTINNSGPGFLAFMNFRWGGCKATYNKSGKYIGHKPIHIWVIGWTDGKICFQKNIDFRTGQLIDECESPIEMFADHVHPAVRDKVLG
jgi:hypothetical protein